MEGKFIIRAGGREKIHEICDDVIAIGSGETSDLRLGDDGVSPEHAEVRRTDRGFKLVDRETVTGTQVNGKPVNQHMLRDGDVIQIGETQLVYQGDSAASPSKPKKPPQQIPTVLPKKEDGEPQRFYRHETVRRQSNPAVLAFVMVIIVGLVITVVILMQSDYRSESQEQVDLIVKLIKKGDVKSLERAKEKLDSIPTNALDDEDRKDLDHEIRKSLSELREDATNREADRRYNQIVASYQNGSKNIRWLRNEIENFARDFPMSGRTEDLNAFLKRAAAGTPQNQKKWEDANADIRTLLRTKSFKPIFEKLKELENDKQIMDAFGVHVAALRSNAQHRFKEHFEVVMETVKDAHSKGDTVKARTLLERLRDVGLEPFATQARAHLAKLE